MTLDSACDLAAVVEIENHKLQPVIKPNPRSSKNQDKLHEQFERFDGVKHIYKERFKIERSFAWEDTYRRLNIRYDRLTETPRRIQSFGLFFNQLTLANQEEMNIYWRQVPHTIIISGILSEL